MEIDDDAIAPQSPPTRIARRGHADEPRRGQLDELRRQCDLLTASDDVPKPVALGIMQMSHTAQTLLLEAEHERREETDKCRHELALLRVAYEYAPALAEMRNEVTQLREQVEALATVSTALQIEAARRRR